MIKGVLIVTVLALCAMATFGVWVPASDPRISYVGRLVFELLLLVAFLITTQAALPCRMMLPALIGLE